MSNPTGPNPPPAPPVARIIVDPHLLSYPDYSLPFADTLRTHLATSQAITETAQNTLEKAAWDAQAAADKVIADEAACLRLERAEKDKLNAAQAIQDELDAIRDKRPKLGAFAADVAVGDDTEPRIPAYAEEKLKNKKWVGLYYFTIAADLEARRSRLTVNPDGMTWVANNGDASGSSYSLAPNVKPSKNIKRFNWEKPHIDILTNFFYLIKSHPIRATDKGPRACQRYADEVRQQWHSRMAAGELTFNIGLINNTRLDKIAIQVLKDDAWAQTSSARADAASIHDTVNATNRCQRYRSPSPCWGCNCSPSPSRRKCRGRSYSPHHNSRRGRSASPRCRSRLQNNRNFQRGTRLQSEPATCAICLGYHTNVHLCRKRSFGMEDLCCADESPTISSPSKLVAASVSSFNSTKAVPGLGIPTVIPVPDAAVRLMAPRDVLELRRVQPYTPL
ncbi:hypothetical protein CPB85DRAFT_1460312 [Mucidula mucida]|nr:hypothetical protein CPB85DRAFT_1460312 [Mucidula mucida]